MQRNLANAASSSATRSTPRSRARSARCRWARPRRGTVPRSSTRIATARGSKPPSSPTSSRPSTSWTRRRRGCGRAAGIRALHRFVEVPWPEALTPLRARFEDERRNFDSQGGFSRRLLFLDDETLLVSPLRGFRGPAPATERRPMPVFGFTVVQLDRAVPGQHRAPRAGPPLLHPLRGRQLPRGGRGVARYQRGRVPVGSRRIRCGWTWRTRRSRSSDHAGPRCSSAGAADPAAAIVRPERSRPAHATRWARTAPRTSPRISAAGWWPCATRADRSRRPWPACAGGTWASARACCCSCRSASVCWRRRRGARTAWPASRWSSWPACRTSCARPSPSSRRPRRTCRTASWATPTA